MKEKKRQEIFVEKGMTNRQRIVLASAGDQEVRISQNFAIFINLSFLAWFTCWRCGVCAQS